MPGGRPARILNYIFQMVGEKLVARTGKHIQCRLRKENTLMVAWIPKSCALLGRTVNLDDPEHGEALGWEVIAVYDGSARDSKWVNERSRDYQKMRGVTDI